jgi:acyl-CoA thioesterase FadM
MRSASGASTALAATTHVRHDPAVTIESENAGADFERFEREVRFQDVDASGFVPVARFFEYAHDAYADLLARGGVSFGDVVRRRAWGAPLVHVDAAISAPARCGDTLHLCIEGVRFGTTSLTVRFAMTGAAGEPIAALATTHAFIDPATRRPRPVPDEVKRALAPLATSDAPHAP